MAQKIIRDIFRSVHKWINPVPLDGQDAQDRLKELLLADGPCMIGRFGSVEIQATFWSMLPSFSLTRRLLTKKVFRTLIANAGFFPINESNIKAFGALMVESMKMCDCLASWRFEEVFFKRYLRKASRIRLGCLGPGNEGYEDSWYKTLENKKILVISPFSELIQIQYRNDNFNKVWDNPDILPGLRELHTIKSVNSIGGNCEFDNWFEALDSMKRQIDSIDFDIAILGCGAYGFPLAAYIKSIGKKAVHMGGSTQLIFGIKGKRWEGKDFINQYWISPRPQDRPVGFEKVEGGCYW
ncbi:MAG: hypothetical protein HDS39_01455 [Bacteroides sp.]|nr:hypothetical protein [Bacteroides sp.]